MALAKRRKGHVGNGEIEATSIYQRGDERDAAREPIEFRSADSRSAITVSHSATAAYRSEKGRITFLDCCVPLHLGCVAFCPRMFVRRRADLRRALGKMATAFEDA